MTLLLLLGTLLGTGALVLAAVIALFMVSRLRAFVFAALAIAWGLAYAAVVVAVSLSSHDKVLPRGEVKRFCGAYLDCHVGVAIAADTVVDAIGERRGSGTFRIITLRFSSTAAGATLSPWQVRLLLEDSRGTRYARDLAAEAGLPGSHVIEHEIPAGGAYEVRVVFDVPSRAEGLRLFAEQGPAFKIPEVVLIGDEASLLHRKTYLAL